MSFVIPSIFTAIDKFSAPIKGMGRTLDSFAGKADVAVARQERLFRRMTPALSETSRQFMSFASSAAIATAVVGGAAFSARSIMDYETELANLQAVTGASGKDFETFKGNIKSVAEETKTSAVTVAQAFTAIANNQPSLLKDADALAAVTKNSILLAQASKMELKPAGEALTQILNQFGKGAADAAKTVDILAAGSVAGSSEIRDTADAIQKFGTVAANAGVKIDESVALIELASRFEKGSEAGQKLRNILITMSTAKVQDPKAVKDMQRLGVNMGIVANKALPLNTRLMEMAKIAKDDAALFHIFGKENQALATGVLSNAAAFSGMLKSVNTPGQAAVMAAKNMATFAETIRQLKDKFVTWLVTSDEAAKALGYLKTGAKFLADNLSTIIKVVGLVIGAFIAWKTYINIVKFSIIAMRAVSAAFFLVDMIKYIASTQGISFATATWTVAQNSLNASMLASPITWILAAVIALAAAIYAVYKHYMALEEIYRKSAEGAKLTAIQKESKAVEELSNKYQQLGMSKAEADQRATSERVAGLDRTSNVLKGKVAEDLAATTKATSSPFGAMMSFLQGDKELNKLGVSSGALGAADAAKTALLNPAVAKTDALANTINTNNASVDINLKDPGGLVSSITEGSDQSFLSLKTTSTLTGN